MVIFEFLQGFQLFLQVPHHSLVALGASFGDLVLVFGDVLVDGLHDWVGPQQSQDYLTRSLLAHFSSAKKHFAVRKPTQAALWGGRIP